MFLKISQNSQESTCAGISFLIKLQTLGLQFHCEFCKIFNTLQNTCFDSSLSQRLQTNGVTESDVKETMKKQFENAPKRKDDEKTQMTQMIGLIRSMLT